MGSYELYVRLLTRSKLVLWTPMFRLYLDVWWFVLVPVELWNAPMQKHMCLVLCSTVLKRTPSAMRSVNKIERQSMVSLPVKNIYTKSNANTITNWITLGNTWNISCGTEIKRPPPGRPVYIGYLPGSWHKIWFSECQASLHLVSTTSSPVIGQHLVLFFLITPVVLVYNQQHSSTIRSSKPPISPRSTPLRALNISQPNVFVPLTVVVWGLSQSHSRLFI